MFKAEKFASKICRYEKRKGFDIRSPGVSAVSYAEMSNTGNMIQGRMCFVDRMLCVLDVCRLVGGRSGGQESVKRRGVLQRIFQVWLYLPRVMKAAMSSTLAFSVIFVMMAALTGDPNASLWQRVAKEINIPTTYQ